MTMTGLCFAFFPLLAGRDIDDRELKRYADLVRGKTHARRRMHGLDHVLDQLLQCCCQLFRRGRFSSAGPGPGIF